ncbi:ABC transporter permease [Streptomyces sp. NPDC048419]|uniref:ABC transporter permease n=1 Tax=Streptomyces sp. NPDC048419 TaxID=3365547 RepID=UPI0037221ABF
MNFPSRPLRSVAPAPDPPEIDARVRPLSSLQRVMCRPEFGAVVGVVFAWTLFSSVSGSAFSSAAGTASYLNSAAELGILAAAVAMLMIAGEFDLSVGSMVGAAGMLMAILVEQFAVAPWLAVVLALLFGAAYGALNGWVVVKTRLPSFIVTLAGLFVLRGLTIALTRMLTGRTQVGGVAEASDGTFVKTLFASSLGPFNISIVWWLTAVVVLTIVLSKTSLGNWLFAVGGTTDAARNIGVPVARVKITAFMATGLAAALVGVIQVMEAGSADTLRGELKELEAITAAVVGGVLLTGGYGSIVGVAFGALTFGIIKQGIFFTGLDTDWFRVILGTLLLGAVLVNNWLRARALKAR